MRNTVLSTFIAAVLLAGGGTRANAEWVFGTPEALGPTVNSNSHEWGCSVTRDRLTLVFSSARNEDGSQGGYDIWITTRTNTSEPFGPAVNLGPIVNSAGGDDGPMITADGLTLFFYDEGEAGVGYRPGGLGGIDVWMTTRTSTSDSFGPPVNLGAPVNSEFTEHLGHLTEDGLTLHFASTRPELLGTEAVLNNIWVATRTSTSEPFGSAAELGPKVNGPGDNRTPSLSPDGRTLFLCRLDESMGLLGWHLYMAERESPYGPFGVPRPIIVGTFGESDWFSHIAPDGSELYFTSTRTGPSNYDIYKAPILRGGHPFRDMTSDFYEMVLGRAPEAGAVDAWQHGYYYYAEDWGVDVRFVMREMARLFFLSDEYSTRSRTDAEFITDCYEAFLLRTPYQDEVDAWTGDIDPGTGEVRWNRAEVMTRFAECAEFGDVILGTFPDLESDLTRDFVTLMYIGCFDRFVDSEGLISWSDTLDSAEDKRQAAKDMASALLFSEEGLAKAPDNETRVIRLYRAFLGRFPATNEIGAWAAQLDSGNETLDSLIEKFGDSTEFTALLREYFEGIPDELTVLLPGDVPLVMARIPAGSFEMGRYPGEQDSSSSEDPRHTVNIAYDFYMAKYELTKRQWQAVLGTTPWSGQDSVLNDPDSPAVYVSWNDVAGSGGFLEKLNQHLASTGQAVGGKPYRLPSESEWEYACRAGTTTRFYWGDDPSYTQIDDYAWYGANREGSYAHVVGRKLPNAWGLYDMSGNVFEWCQDDWYHDNYTGAPTDGSAWVAGGGSYRVLRGGRWSSYAGRCRSANRSFSYPSYTYDYLGFRPSRSN